MKVAVTAVSDNVTSEIDPRFGRARYLVLVDTDSGAAAVHDNSAALNAAHGAGVLAAQTVIDHRAEAVITGNVGPKALQALRAAGVQVYLTYVGTVESTVQRLMQGRLQPTTGPSRGQHPG
jgi:predicted Fe-Mo cluster-binding NifX family protein